MKKAAILIGIFVAVHLVLFVASSSNDRDAVPQVLGQQQVAEPQFVYDTPAAGAILNPALAQAFAQRSSGLQVQGYGEVVKVLSDDNDGSRHQRFLVDVGGNQTILIAHNIDIAPRVPNLRERDVIEFFGVYEWKSEGGTVHWTHHDPGGHHVAGWLRHNGRMHQ